MQRELSEAGVEANSGDRPLARSTPTRTLHACTFACQSASTSRHWPSCCMSLIIAACKVQETTWKCLHSLAETARLCRQLPSAAPESGAPIALACLQCSAAGPSLPSWVLRWSEPPTVRSEERVAVHRLAHEQESSSCPGESAVVTLKGHHVHLASAVEVSGAWGPEGTLCRRAQWLPAHLRIFT